jgi:L-ascorbate metabolism protein UlaG (beta-lactamase superfamily)
MSKHKLSSCPAFLLVGSLLVICAAALAGCESAPAQAAIEADPTPEPTPEPTPSPTPIAASPDIVVQGTGDETLTITYVGNAGYLIESGDTKVVIDAYFHWTSECGVVPPDYQELMREGAPPFDDIDLMLATHDHGDHFDPEAVGAYLETHPGTAFVSTAQAERAVDADYPELEQLDERVVGLYPSLRERVPLTANGIPLEIMPLPHGFSQNLGILMTINGYSLLHVGDLGADTLVTTLDPLRTYGFADEHIDVIFLPYHYMQGDEQRAVADFFDVSWLIPTHLYPCACFGPMGAGYLDTETVLANYPDAIMLEEEMQRFIVEPESQ